MRSAATACSGLADEAEGPAPTASRRGANAGPPLEASTLPLYGLEPDNFDAPFGVILPLSPLAELFAEAWEASGG